MPQPSAHTAPAVSFSTLGAYVPSQLQHLHHAPRQRTPLFAAPTPPVGNSRLPHRGRSEECPDLCDHSRLEWWAWWRGRPRGRWQWNAVWSRPGQAAALVASSVPVATRRRCTPVLQRLPLLSWQPCPQRPLLYGPPAVRPDAATGRLEKGLGSNSLSLRSPDKAKSEQTACSLRLLT